MTTTCPTPDELVAFARGELPIETLEAVGAHLSTCPECERVAQTLDETQDPVVEILRRFPQPPAHSDAMRQTVSLGGPVADTPVAPAPRWLGGYEVLEELGRGGMGVVYKAWDTTLKRYVALKVILSGVHATADEAIRFRREAEAVARLRHPNLVQIYEVGQHDGLPFLSLEYVPGCNLDRYLAGNPQSSRSAARLVATLAEGVHAAHLQGVVHRDLKPSNILVSTAPDIPDDGGSGRRKLGATEDGLIPKVTDFGLAKCLDAPGGVTGNSVVAGTPCYMAPEQAAGRAGAVGPAADVYGLGVILYEMLVGNPPFRGESAADTLLQVIHDEPVPPSRLRRRLPRDLETICLKCLRKDPARRYATARELAEDLNRFLGDVPIRARRAGSVERLVRLCRRNPLPAVLLALVVVSLVAGTAAASYFAVRAVDSAATARKNEAVARQEKAAADAARDEVRRNLYYAEMHLAGQSRHFNRALTRVNALLAPWQPEPGQPDPRGWEWHYLDALGRQDLLRLPHGGGVLDIAWDRDGDRLATAGADGVVRVWDARDGSHLTALHGSPPLAQRVAWHRDGALATGGSDGAVCVWDVATGRHRRLWSHKGPVCAVSWSPDGRLGSAGLSDGTARIGNVAGGEEQVIDLGTASLHNVAWNPAWTRLAVGGRKAVRMLNLTGGPAVDVVGAGGNVSWSDDGNLLAVGREDFTIGIIGPETGRLLRTLRGHRHRVEATHWSPDNRTLCSVGRDHSVRVWNVPEGRQLHTSLGHTDEVFAVRWSPQGDRVASGGTDGSVRVWLARLPVQRIARTVTGVAWSGDGTRLAVVGGGGAVHVLDRRTRRPTSPAGGYTIGAAHAAWAPKAAEVACAVGNEVRVIDPDSSRALRTLKGSAGAVRMSCWHPDGTRLASVAADAAVRIWDVAGEKLLATLRGDGRDFQAVAWSRDGTRVAAAAQGRIQVWDADGGPVAVLDHDKGRVDSLAWGPDDRLAAGDSTGRVVIWDVAARRERLVMSGGRDWVRSVAWSPDGRRLASATQGVGMLVWDPDTGKQAFIGEVDGNVVSLAWSPDGTAVAGASESDGTLVLWDAAASYHHHHHAPHLQHWTKLAERLDPLIEQGSTTEALGLLRTAREHAHGNPAVLRTIAGFYRRAGDRLRQEGKTEDAAAAHAEARREYERLLAATPGDTLTARALADMLLDGVTRWHPLKPTRLDSAGGATLTVQPDDSILVGGANPAHDAYEVTARPELARVTAVRLEAIPDARQPYRGAGRFATNGNFLVSGFRVAVASGEGGGPTTPVPLTAAVADYANPYSPEANVLDDSPDTAWDTFPRQREPRWLVARIDPPAAGIGEQSLVVTIEFRCPRWTQHALGRFRLSVTDEPRAYLAGLLQVRRLTGDAESTRLAAAYLLSGDARTAGKWLQPVAEGRVAGGVCEWLLLALVHHELGGAEEARRWYDLALAAVGQNPPDDLVRELAAEAAARLGRKAGSALPGDVKWPRELPSRRGQVSQFDPANPQLSPAGGQRASRPGMAMLR